MKRRVVLTVAEYGEFHNMGEYEETTTAKRAVGIFKRFLAKHTCGVPSIGIRVHSENDISDDMELDVVYGKAIDLSMLPYVPQIVDNREAKELLKNLILLLPEYEVIGNLPLDIVS